MTSAKETTVTRYTINGNTFEVGNRLKLTGALNKRLKALTAASRKADAALAAVYADLISDNVDASRTVDAYFIEYQAAAAHKAYLLGEFNRALITHFNGFVPVQIHLTDDPHIVVRPFEQNEPDSFTIDQVRQATDWDNIGAPALDILLGVTNTERSQISTDFAVWQALSSMVFTTKTKVTPAELFDDSIRTHLLVERILNVLRRPSVVNVPYIILTSGEAGTVVVATKPSQMMSPEFANYVYTSALDLAGASKDSNLFTVNIFSETTRNDAGTVETIVSIMFYRVAEGSAHETCALRYKREPNGDLSFDAIWNADDIRKNIEQLAKK